MAWLAYGVKGLCRLASMQWEGVCMTWLAYSIKGSAWPG